MTHTMTLGAGSVTTKSMSVWMKPYASSTFRLLVRNVLLKTCHRGNPATRLPLYLDELPSSMKHVANC